jgi:hypothetical protein
MRLFYAKKTLEFSDLYLKHQNSAPCINFAQYQAPTYPRLYTAAIAKAQRVNRSFTY